MMAAGTGSAVRMASESRRTWLDRLRTSRIASWVRSALTLLRGLRVEVWRVEGAEKSSGLPISMLCAADRETKAYLLDLVVDDSFRETFLGKRWIWSVSKLLPEIPDCSLVAVAAQRSLMKCLHLQNSFFVPAWVELEIGLPIDERTMKRWTIRSDLRRIKKHDLRYALTAESEAIQDFYDNYYRPYIARVHGASAVILSRESILAKVGQCELLRVIKQGAVIAGMLIDRDRLRPRLWCLGVRDGSSDYIDQGALIAAYQFSFEYLTKEGFPKVGLGWCRALLRDGVLRYKSKWSPRIAGTTADGFAFSFPSCSRATQSFLLNNPFIFEKSGQLYGALFVPPGRHNSEELQAFERLYNYLGVSKSVHYLLPETGPAPIFEPTVEGRG